MEPSPYQRAIYEAVETTEDNIIVQACAGSGKTTTLKGIGDRLPKGQRVVALCFNKANAEDFAAKLPRHIESSTMHSLGWRILRENIAGLPRKAEDTKQRYWETELWGKAYGRNDADKERILLVRKIVPLLRATCRNATDMSHIMTIITDYFPSTDLSDMDPYRIASDCSLLLDNLREDTKRIDFDDMLDLVVHRELTGKHYDIILGDEVQDWTPQQAEFISLMSEGNGSRRPDDSMTELLAMAGLSEAKPDHGRPTESRLILVGDECQAIYGFRGADTDSMANLQKRFECTQMPLSVCYRCPTSVITMAQGIVGEGFILPRDGAPEGKIIKVPRGKYFETLSDLPEGAMVVCRTNAPLVPAAMFLIRNHRKAVVKGKDIGKGLVAIITSCERELSKNEDGLADQIQQRGRRSLLVDLVYQWALSKIDGFVADERMVAASHIEDQYGCIKAISEDCTTPGELKQTIEDVFKDETEGIMLSSAHRSKGLEADHVVILAPELMPHPMTVKYGNEEQLRQERNLKYVAVTRAMETLTLLPLPANGDSAFPSLRAKLAVAKLKESLPPEPAEDTVVFDLLGLQPMCDDLEL